MGNLNSLWDCSLLGWAITFNMLRCDTACSWHLISLLSSCAQMNGSRQDEHITFIFFFLHLPEYFVLEGPLCCSWVKISISAWTALPRVVKTNLLTPVLMVQGKRPLWRPRVVTGILPPWWKVLKKPFSAADSHVLGRWCWMASMKLALARRLLSYTNTRRSLLLGISRLGALPKVYLSPDILESSVAVNWWNPAEPNPVPFVGSPHFVWTTLLLFSSVFRRGGRHQLELQMFLT